ncbi:MAG: hypothetical protein U0T69_06670 [Chitinophagales bacterium]
MRKIIVAGIMACLFIQCITGCKKAKTGESICNGNSENVIGSFEGKQRVFIGPIDLVAAGLVPEINDELLNSNLAGNKIAMSFDFLQLSVTSDLNNVSNNVLTLDSIIFENRSIEISTGLDPPLDQFELWNLRAGGTVKFNCDNTITTELKVKSCSTSVASLDTIPNLIKLDGKNVRLVGTFTRK